MHMRSILSAAVAVLVTACLSSAHPAATRAQARHDIARAIAAESGGAPARKIVDVRDVSADRAVVLTSSPGDEQPREERWVRGADGWKRDGASAAAGPIVGDGSR